MKFILALLLSLSAFGQSDGRKVMDQADTQVGRAKFIGEISNLPHPYKLVGRHPKVDA